MSKSDQPTAPASSRRSFIKHAATAGAGIMIVPRHVLGQGMTPPSDLVNIATVGVNGMGASNTAALLSQNIVALCDVDFGQLDARLNTWRNGAYPIAASPATPTAPTAQPAAARPAWTDFGPSKAQQTADRKWKPEQQAALLRRFVDRIPRVARFRDYREMLEKQKDIDGIVVATPDHMHAVIASTAMQLGKHVYVQKPLCWSVHEARHLSKLAAANPKVVTQMGNQGHSTDGARRGQEYLLAGAIGEIRDVHVWTNRPLGYWPQGVPRPAAMAPGANPPAWNNNGLTARLANAMAGTYPVPNALSWDLFLGVAPHVDYHPIYHPFNWRGWLDWGQGALGDMGAHLVDHPVWGLKLGLPTSIETISTPFNGVTFPNATTTYYEFAARPGMPPVKMTWYDGGLLPPRPAEMGEEKLNPTGGVLYIGSKGKMLQDTYGVNPRLLPTALHNSSGAPREQLSRVPHQSHEMNWVNAIRGREEVSCPFSYASVLTEIMLLGVVAMRANTKLHYDGAAGRVTNHAGANEFLTRNYRSGYSL